MEEHVKALTVQDIASILGIGINKAYQIVSLPDFPCIRHGNRIIIPAGAFFRWLDEQAIAHRVFAS